MRTKRKRMNCVEMVHAVRSLGDVRVMRLCGSRGDDDIERYKKAWIQWVLSYDTQYRIESEVNGRARGIGWFTVDDCHDDYREALKEKAKDRTKHTTNGHSSNGNGQAH